MIVFYNILVYIVFIAALPFIPFVWLFSGKRRANLLQRIGFSTGFENLPDVPNRIWVHALSVGEVISSIPLVDAIRERYPMLDIVFTASTKTGYDTARDRFFSKDPARVDYLGYFPFDVPCSVNRIYRMVQPDAVILVETDLWPGFLQKMKAEAVPVVLVNARLSERSLNGYLKFKRFSALFFSSLAEIMVQSEMDKQRYTALGIDEKKINVTGNIKFDQPVPRTEGADPARLRNLLSIPDGSKVIIGGSTHDGEEEILLSVFQKLKKRFSNLILIIAPRDPKRALNLKQQLFSNGLSVQLYSEAEEGSSRSEPSDVVFVDCMGVLAGLYAVCDAAFVGGSMVRAGGHNPLEPAAFGKPIFFGSDMSDFQAVSDLLKARGGAVQVENGDALENGFAKVLENETLKKQMGENSFKVFESNSGAVKKIMARLEALEIV